MKCRLRRTDLRRRMVAPESGTPVGVGDGDIVELIGSTNRRLLWNLDDRFS
jgi:hypothetical protein